MPDDLAKRLDDAVDRDRRDALVAGVCIVALTTASLWVVSWFLGRFAQGAEGRPPDPVRLKVLLSSLNGFLGWMFFATGAGALVGGARWGWILAGAGTFALQCLLSYATALPFRDPRLFGTIYGALSFVTLGLIGHAYVPRDDTFLPGPYAVKRRREQTDLSHEAAGFLVAIPRFIVGGFADAVGSAWVWRPLSAVERRAAVEILGRLVVRDAEGAERRLAQLRRREAVHVMRWLDRLDFVRRREQGLLLTGQGEEFADAGRR